jgi:hypothetical protein
MDEMAGVYVAHMGKMKMSKEFRPKADGKIETTSETQAQIIMELKDIGLDLFG